MPNIAFNPAEYNKFYLQMTNSIYNKFIYYKYNIIFITAPSLYNKKDKN